MQGFFEAARVSVVFSYKKCLGNGERKILMKFIRLFLPLFLLTALFQAAGQELKSPIDIHFQPGDSRWPARHGAPLKTPWGQEVSPANVHPDYPRPTLARKEWLNLNGLWDWKDADRQVALSVDGEIAPLGQTLRDTYDAKILVPFPIESSLSGIGRVVERSVYRRYFTIPEHWPRSHRVILHFGAVDWEALVSINGRPIGKHQGGYDPFSFDITDSLTTERDAVQELVVQVFDPTGHGQQPRGKQSTQPSGIQYSSASGIWQTVWLEPVPPKNLKMLRFSPDIQTGILTIEPLIDDPTPDLSLFVEAFDGDEVVARAYGGVDGPLLMRFPRDLLKYWSPDSPHLYQLRIRLMQREQPVDQVGSYVAFRKIDLTQNALGQTRIRLNGRILFQMGILDQGYWPDGIYTAPTDQAIQTEVLVAKRLGFNMIRKHVKIEPERWYYWCDRYGMLVWQDMPNGENRSQDSREQFRLELQRMIQSRSNHPSIVAWTIFNEGWGQYETEQLVEMVRSLDSNRLVNAASGWTDHGVGHLNDHHKFPGPEGPRSDTSRSSVIGSFGGLTLVPPKKNLWTTETWGYQHVPDSETLIRRYRAMHEQLRRLIREEGLSAAVFHQFVDVESECNGLLSYDRVLQKVPTETFEEINRETIRFGSAPPMD